MAAKQKTLDDLFFHTLKDIYYAERKILKNLPRMAKATESGELRQAFETHREETQGQIERIEQVFEMLGKRASGKTWRSIPASRAASAGARPRAHWRGDCQQPQGRPAIPLACGASTQVSGLIVLTDRKCGHDNAHRHRPRSSLNHNALERQPESPFPDRV